MPGIISAVHQGDRGKGRSRRPHGLREPTQQGQHSPRSRGPDREGRRRGGAARLPCRLAGHRTTAEPTAAIWRCSRTCTARSATARLPCSPSSRPPRAPTARPRSSSRSTTSGATRRNAGWPGASIGANSSTRPSRPRGRRHHLDARERAHLSRPRTRPRLESRQLRAMGRRTARGRPSTAAIEGRVPHSAHGPTLPACLRPAEDLKPRPPLSRVPHSMKAAVSADVPTTLAMDESQVPARPQLAPASLLLPCGTGAVWAEG
jgi:hypothetical protein